MVVVACVWLWLWLWLLSKETETDDIGRIYQAHWMQTQAQLPYQINPPVKEHESARALCACVSFAVIAAFA